MSPAKWERRAAFTLIELVVVVAVISILTGIALAAVQKAREVAARSKCQNNLRQAALALHHCHDANGSFPMGHQPLSIFNPSPMPLSGWTIPLLPFLEQQALFDQAVRSYGRKAIPFPPNPHAGLSTVVPMLTCPSDARIVTAQVGKRTGTLAAFTSYLGVSGRDSVYARDGILYQGSRTRFADITDGSSNTLLIGERPPSADLQFGWWYAGIGQQSTGSADIVLGVRESNLMPISSGSPCGPGQYPFMAGSGFDDACAMFHFWSPHAGGANFALADGSARFILYTANPMMPALSTTSGGEVESLSE